MKPNRTCFDFVISVSVSPNDSGFDDTLA